MKLVKEYETKILKKRLKNFSINYKKLIDKIIENKKIIVICGPTGVGKSKIAVNLAKILKTDIISIDSMQVYKGMEIGTDKYNTEEDNIKQYMIDLFFPDHYVTVVEFRDICRKIIEEKFFHKKKIPILVGGSGLYIRGVIDELEFIPRGNKQIRDTLKEKIEKEGLPAYYKKLTKIDPLYSKKISKNDKRRLIRALEVYEITGKPFSYFQNKWEKRKSVYNSIIFGIEEDRKKLYENIEKRVDYMFERGLVEEVRELLEKGYNRCYSLMQAVGYKEVMRYLSGEIDITNCIQEVKKNTRRLAKKQLTWFKADPRIKWIRIDNYDSILSLKEDILKNIWISFENG